jgi:hypothetical protein
MLTADSLSFAAGSTSAPRSRAATPKKGPRPPRSEAVYPPSLWEAPEATAEASPFDEEDEEAAGFVQDLYDDVAFGSIERALEAACLAWWCCAACELVEVPEEPEEPPMVGSGQTFGEGSGEAGRAGHLPAGSLYG